jgi:cation-transporting ATPase F
MARLARTIGVLLAAVGMVAGRARGIPIDELFLILVALAVSAIPEGISIAFTVALAIDLQHMVHRSVVICCMPAVETFGFCDVIGSDKTGMLTENRMAVRRIVTPKRNYEVTGGTFRDDGLIRRDEVDDIADFDPALVAAALCNDARLERLDGEFTIQGTPRRRHR